MVGVARCQLGAHLVRVRVRVGVGVRVGVRVRARARARARVRARVSLSLRIRVGVRVNMARTSSRASHEPRAASHNKVSCLGLGLGVRG